MSNHSALAVSVPVLAVIVGALVYALSATKAGELGRIAYACGLLVLVWQLAGVVAGR